MADAVSPHRHQYVRHWLDWRGSAAAAHYCAAGPVRPVPDKYAFQATDEQTKTNRQTEGHRHRMKPPPLRRGL